MRRKFLFIAVPILIVICTFIGGQVVKLLWNWLLPDLFGFRQIGFWQALGLLALCRILFGGMGVGSRARSNAKRRADERWEKMTPEEREKLRQGFRGHWASEPPADPKASG